MPRVNNYLKTPRRVTKKNELVEPEHFFFFNDLDPDSRREAWLEATMKCDDPAKISIHRGTGRGRYPHEGSGDPHPIVTERLTPISQRVQVIGYAFERGVGLPELLS